MRPIAPVLALALALTACAPAPTGGVPRPLTKVNGNKAPTTPDHLVPGTGANIVGNNGSNIISDNGASLIGKVKAPAQLIGNNGAGVVSNGGGNLRLLATLDQVPVAGRPARLKNAAGQVLETTTTDASGQYGFTIALPDQNLVVEVELAGGKGVVQAIAPRGAKQADADLVSTLTTGYILDRFVRGQADPVATLGKLPADVERDTRFKAGAAFAGGTAAVPESLTPEAVVATVEALRSKDQAFDLQMEAVKRLLIPAGLSNLGEGVLATEVELGTLSGLAVGKDGKLYIASQSQSRIWRLDPDGRLRGAVGKGVNTVRFIAKDDPNPEGPPEAYMAIVNQPGDQVPLYGAGSLYAAPDGSIVFEDQVGVRFDLGAEHNEFPGRLMRINADGTVTKLLNGRNFYGMWADANGDAFSIQRSGTEVRLLRLRDGQPMNVAYTFTGPAAPIFAHGADYGRDAQGRYYVHSFDYATGIQRFDPATGALERLMEMTAETNNQTYLDPTGHVFMYEAKARTVRLRKPDGTTSTLLAAAPEALAGWTLDTAVAGPDDTYFLGFDSPVSGESSRIYRVKNGQAELVAGTTARASSGQVDSTALKPHFVAPGSNGDVIVAESEHGRIVRVGADGKITVVVGGGAAETGWAGLGGDQIKLEAPGRVATNAQGELFFLETKGVNRGIYKRGTDGRLIEAMRPKAAETVKDFALAPDGTLYIYRYDTVSVPLDPNENFGGSFSGMIGPGGGPPMKNVSYPFVEVRKNGQSVSHPIEPKLFSAAFAFGNGLGYFFEDEKLYRWSAEAGMSLVMEEKAFATQAGADEDRLAVDAAGKVYLTRGRSLFFSDNDSQVLRIDPVAKTFVPIAGKDAPYLNGTGVDDGLNAPQSPVFDAEGNLLVVDYINRQIKRLPKNKL